MVDPWLVVEDRETCIFANELETKKYLPRPREVNLWLSVCELLVHAVLLMLSDGRETNKMRIFSLNDASFTTQPRTLDAVLYHDSLLRVY